jgi:hypothetical protein
MCLGQNDKGGPYRCSGHMRAARDRAHAAVTELDGECTKSDTIANNLRTLQQQTIEEHIPESERFVASLAGVSEEQLAAMPEQARDLYITLNGKLDWQRERRDKLGTQLDGAKTRLAKAEDDYRATPDGAGEAMRDVERLAASLTTSESEGQRKLAMNQALMRLHEAENRMAQEGFERRDRWGSTETVPAVRAAQTGAQTDIRSGERISPAGIVVHEAAMHGTYSNSFTSDPEGMETAGSGSGEYAIRKSRVEVVRGDTNVRVTIPMRESSTYHDTSGPTIRQTIASAVERAEKYNPDYPTWARENGFHTTDQGWAGSASYSLGRDAHKEAKAVSSRIRRFLDSHEYEAIAKELHANA